MSTQLPTRPELLRQYEISIDLHKHYLKLALELNVFYYAITGALVSYFFAHRSEPLMQWTLLLPFLMSILFAALFIYGGIQQNVLRREVFQIRNALGFHSAPELLVLSVFLYIFATLMLAVAFALAALMFCMPSAT
jgi:hypothetical protein